MRSATDIDLAIKHLDLPEKIPNIEDAAARIVRAVQNQERVIVASDYDADGATSTALVVSFLSSIGATDVSFDVPDRVLMGYGLSLSFAQRIAQKDPDLVITVDNGISSVDGIGSLRQIGTDVIVTDHHLAPDTLPDATCIVNPNVGECAFDSKPAGVGVAFYVMAVVRRQLVANGYFEKAGNEPPIMSRWLDLVAVGTIADMVPLTQNNRRLVAGGLQRFKANQIRPGLQALCSVAKVDPQFISSSDIGFKIGPRINAAGRIEDMATGIKCLLSESGDEANQYAKKLDKTNQDRRDRQEEMTRVAQDSIRHVAATLEGSTSRCIFHESFHEGIVGLVAGRITRDVGLPTIVFAPSADDVSLRGSARSTSEVHIRDVLADIDRKYPKLMPSFGGHAMAAGLTIRKANFERFRGIFEKAGGERVAERWHHKFDLSRW